ncbi:MAG: hypothetical protein WDA22_15130 [Bacteroidota bacterium]
MTKDFVMKTLKEFPDLFTIDELVEKLVFKQKVQNGLEQSEKDNTFSSDEAKKQLTKWLS